MRRTWPDYRAVWRWHFYASLYCIPFVILLSVTGAIYLFKAEIEAALDQPFDQRAPAPAAPVAAQVTAAVAAIPGARPMQYELPATATSAARVLVRSSEGESIRVYVDPTTLQVLHQVPDQERLMRVMFRLHGELLMGDRGSNLVEIAASWTILMILTGLFLWWPRGQQGWGGILYPRLHKGQRVFWRDLHGMTGFWVSSLALFLLITGLPWAKFWGGYFKTVRQLGQASPVQQDWSTGSERRREPAGDHAGHSRRGSGPRALAEKDLIGFDRVAATVIPLNLEPPVVIAPPSREGGPWTARSMTANRPHRVTLDVDGSTGQVLRREDFRDRPLLDQIVGIGIAAHEGRLFGWPNQALGLLATVGLIALSLSGLVMWWRRRETGSLGAPRILVPPRFSATLLGVVLVLGILLPLFAATLVVTLLADVFLWRRLPRVRDWLGLTPPAPASLPVATDH